jgi:hypothetical protein
MALTFEHGLVFRDRSGTHTDEFPTPVSLTSARRVAHFWATYWHSEVGLFARRDDGLDAHDPVEWVSPFGEALR